MRNNLSLKRQLKEKIFLLKNNFPSWSIRDISRQIGCSKSTTHYHLTEGSVDKIRTKIFQLLDKIWPGMVKENDSFQAVSQWTGKPDFYDDGTPIMTPYVRCKLTNEVIDVKNGSTHADHVDGDRTNNSIENFSAVVGWSNQMKSESPGYYEMADRMITILNNIRKHNKDIDELINNKLKENN